jgi:hypothetical protein
LLFVLAVFSKVAVVTVVLFLIWCDVFVFVRTRHKHKQQTHHAQSKSSQKRSPEAKGLQSARGGAAATAVISGYYTALLAIGATAADITHRHTIPHDDPELSDPPSSLSTRVCRASQAVLFYLFKTCCPPPLSGLSVHYLSGKDTDTVYYDTDGEGTAAAAVVPAMIAIVVALTTLFAALTFIRAALAAFQSTASTPVPVPVPVSVPTLTFAFLWLGYGVLILPTLGLMGEHTAWVVAADRYCYLPALLLAPTAVAVLVMQAGKRAADVRFCFGMGVVAISLALSSQQQSRIWATEEVSSRTFGPLRR